MRPTPLATPGGIREARAEPYVNGASQPALIVTDLKSPRKEGRVALWVGSGTDGYFANLTIRPDRSEP